MATHSSTLAWRIPWTQEPGGLPSTGSHRVGHDWSDLAAVVVWQIHSYYSISCGQDTSPSVSSCVNQMGACMDVQSIQSCPTLCDPVNCSPPGSSVHGILQARILEQVAMPSSRESSQPRDWTRISCIEGRFFTHWVTWEAQPSAYS